ncbi:MAG: carbohydrate porin [Candidatus Glassbacteria bacterium]|nr:carbohydrate porin [Candidatus Glassbacteria bacterium]
MSFDKVTVLLKRSMHISQAPFFAWVFAVSAQAAGAGVEKPDSLRNNGSAGNEIIESSYSSANQVVSSWNKWVSSEVVYRGDFLAKQGGGGGYLGQMNLSLEFDLEKMGLWNGGMFYVRGEQSHGNWVTEHYAATFHIPSNLEAHDYTQLSEYWLEQTFAQEKLTIRLGKQEANEEFCAMEFGEVLLLDAFGPTPVIPMATFPVYGLGLSVFLRPVDGFKLAGGVFDGAGRGGQWGFSTAFDGTGGTFSILEIGLEPAWAGSDELRDNFRLGLWSHSADLGPGDGNPLSTESFESNYGVYVAIDKYLYAEPVTGNEEFQGLGAFATLGWTPSDHNELFSYIGVGLNYFGPFGGRDADIFSLGLAHTRVGKGLEKNLPHSHETVLELGYTLQVSSNFSLHQVVQYFVNPAASGDNTVFGILSFELAL